MPRGLGKGPGAVVLQEQTSPLQFLTQATQLKQQREALQAKQAQENYEKRWKYYKEQQAIGNDPVGSEWTKEFNQYWKAYNNDLNQWMQSGRDINVMDDERFFAQRKYMQDWARSANAIDAWRKEDQERAEKDKWIDDDMSERVNYELSHDRAGNTISPVRIPVSELYSRKYSPENLHRGLFRFDGYTKDFFDNTDENIYKTYEEKMLKNNTVVDMVEYRAKVARPIYADPLNPDSNEIIGWDRTVDKHTYNEFINNALANSWMEEELRQRGVEPTEDNKMELLQEYADQYSQLTKNTTSTKGRTGEQAGGVGVEAPAFQNRVQVIEDIYSGSEEALSRARARGAEIKFNYPVQPGEWPKPQPGVSPKPKSVTVKYFKERPDITGMRMERVPIDMTIDFSDPVRAYQELNNVLNDLSPAKQNVDADLFYNYIIQQGQPGQQQYILD